MPEVEMCLPEVEMWLPEVEMWLPWTENCEYFGKRLYKHVADHFWDFLEKVPEAKWRCLGVVYRYGFISQISPIWNLILLEFS